MSTTIEINKYSLSVELKDAIKENLYFIYMNDLNVDLDDEYHETLSNTMSNMTIYKGTCKEIVHVMTGYDPFDEWDNQLGLPSDWYEAAYNALNHLAQEHVDLEECIEELKQENITK